MPHSEDKSLSVVLAVDIGGTFTDLVLLGNDGVHKAKILSSPSNYAHAVIEGVRLILESSGHEASEIRAVFHGMTVATNAVLERRGANVGLVTTHGFRDVLELARGRRPSMYDLSWEKPKPLVPRRMRFEIEQRITAAGELDPPASHRAVTAVATELRSAGVVSVAVCLLNSFIRPDEERRVTRELQDQLPELFFTASVDIAPQVGEYERTSTAVVNAYVAPVVDTYLGRLEAGLAALQVNGPLSVMQSSGGLLNAATARRKPVYLIESGPAAGVMAVRGLARKLGLNSVIAFDMGGTTAKAALIENGEPLETSEYEVGAGMNAKRGANVGAGYSVLTPSLDIAEVGSGGGSIIWIDAGGAPRVGPRSAGASPGPACYGAGGELPTLSDAVLVLGYLDPRSIAGGRQLLRLDLAEAALATIAGPLGLTVEEAAYGAYQIAVGNITRLIKAVTSERGRDPRESILVAFGGAGPAYAASIARELGMTQVIVPAAPGLFSAVGLLISDPRYDDVRPYLSETISLATIRSAFAEMEGKMLRTLRADGHVDDEITLSRHVDMRYSGQRGTLAIGVPSGSLTDQDMETLRDRLDAEHYRIYGHRKARATALIANLRLRATCISGHPETFDALAVAERKSASALRTPIRRAAYFGPDAGWVSTRVLWRGDLQANAACGPLVIEDLDSTTVVPPTAKARLDAGSNIIIDVDMK